MNALRNDPLSAYVLQLPAFRLWWETLDARLRDYTGCPAASLPIPEQTWRLWWQSGRTARFVAEALAFYLTERVSQPKGDEPCK